jgi:hypothetical protein
MKRKQSSSFRFIRQENVKIRIKMLRSIAMPQSEIVQIRAKIEQEIISMRLGLNGLAAGTAKHAFIEAKMHCVGAYEKQLATHIGGEQAVLFSCQTYIRVMEGKEQ